MYQPGFKAIIAAREDEALTHGQVLYGLIKPTKAMDQVESTAAMVNVIPKKRIYRMETPQELDLFLTELMKRPLVLQPSAFIGRGLAIMRCTLYTKEERWILLINQTYPKIRDRIHSAIETAKMKMSNGQPFVLEISLNAFLKKVYLNCLTRAILDERFTFIDFEGADIVIRYPGDNAHRGLKWEMKTSKIHIEFEDLNAGELIRRTVMEAQREWSSPALRVIMPDELCTLLPDWTFEMIDPMEGVIPPEVNEELEGATGGYEVTPEDDSLVSPPPSYDRVVGRSHRKTNIKAGMKLEIPVELHAGNDMEPPGYGSVEHPGNSGVVGRAKRKANQSGNNLSQPVEMHHAAERPRNLPSPTTRPLSSPGRNQMPDTNRQNEVANRNRVPDHMYTDMSVSPGFGQSAEQHYESMNLAKPHSQYDIPSSRSPVTPRTHLSPKSQQTPVLNPEDRYNTEHVNKTSTQKTYLTDDDDGGFMKQASRSPHSPSSYNRGLSGRQLEGGLSPHSPKSPYNKYDSNYNQPGNDRYADGDRYSVPSSSRQTRQGYQGTSDRSGPVPAPRGFHRHQGSGRSDTSASDSGFGENENGHDSHSSLYRTGNGYSNQAYQDDSPDRHGNHGMVDDIMAKHKALAAKMMHESGQSVPRSNTRQDYNGDSNYNKELQKWRQNINDLEESCDSPNVSYSGQRYRTGSDGEPMAESFI